MLRATTRSLGSTLPWPARIIAGGGPRLCRAAAVLFVCGLLAAAARQAPWRLGWLLARELVSAKNHEPACWTESFSRDLGTLTAGGVVHARFAVANRGGKRLLIVRERTSCGCLSTEPEVSILPGDERVLDVRLDTRPLRGAVDLVIRYRTNDRRCPVLDLHLIADIAAAAPDRSSPPALEPVPEAVDGGRGPEQAAGISAEGAQRKLRQLARVDASRRRPSRAPALPRRRRYDRLREP